MKVTSGGGHEPLVDQVLDELRRIRKRRSGIDVGVIAESQAVCGLLGGGDPYVAYNRLLHRILDSGLDLEVRAAAASLGLGSDGGNHLDRLTDFGNEVGLDQRQVRRLSDRGLVILARLICTNWPTETVPELTAVVTEGGNEELEMFVTTRHLSTVAMKPPRISAIDELGAVELAYDADGRTEGMWNLTWARHPIGLRNQHAGLHIDIVWRGELWPKFTATCRDLDRDVEIQTLGNKMRVSLRARPK